MILNTSQPLCVNEILRSQYKKRHFWKIIQKNVQALLSGEKKKKKKQVTKQNEACASPGAGVFVLRCVPAPRHLAHTAGSREKLRKKKEQMLEELQLGES